MLFVLTNYKPWCGFKWRHLESDDGLDSRDRDLNTDQWILVYDVSIGS